MKNLKSYQFLTESKQLNYKTIPEMFEYINSLPSNLVFLDTETSGLGGATIQQITQISAIIVDSNFKEIDLFDEKIELTDDIKTRMELKNEFPNGIQTPSNFIKDPWSTKKILKFNHYSDGDYKYVNEKDSIDNFFKWLGQYKPYTLVAQNAPFDMSMLGGRYNHKIDTPVLDTKLIIQLYYIPLLQKLSETDSKYRNTINLIGTSGRDNGLISSSLAKIGPSLDIDMSNYHDALTDCKITIEMIEKIFNLLEEHKDVDISKYQIERIKIINNI
tara:strand:+ start:41115 stop:41936 length:822 start_codon:yes stop_codon:yes gene_type:complete